MIRVVDPGLDADTVTRLDAHQRDVDACPSYAEQIERAEALYKQHGRSDRSPFREVHLALRGMCSGNARCMYCEDAPASEVEHVRPKSLYPELTFRWANFLYGCGPCNRSKGNRYTLFSPRGSSTELNTARARGAAIVPPPDGDPLLLDPRVEDPLDFLRLDLLGTFFFVPVPPSGTRERRRAEYTVDVLGLNERDVLVTARRQAYLHFCNAMRAFVEKRDDEQREAVVRGNHATVWAEMKRQRAQIPRLRELFAAAPEALAWG